MIEPDDSAFVHVVELHVPETPEAITRLLVDAVEWCLNQGWKFLWDGISLFNEDYEYTEPQMARVIQTYYNDRNLVTYRFRSPTDAMLFKLTWGGV